MEGVWLDKFSTDPVKAFDYNANPSSWHITILFFNHD